MVPFPFHFTSEWGRRFGHELLEIAVRHGASVVRVHPHKFVVTKRLGCHIGSTFKGVLNVESQNFYAFVSSC